MGQVEVMEELKKHDYMTAQQLKEKLGLTTIRTSLNKLRKFGKVYRFETYEKQGNQSRQVYYCVMEKKKET